MPYHFFEGATNVVPVDTEMKTKDLKAQEVSTTRENYHLSRQNRPVCDWSALDSAKEFKFRLLSEYPSVPGDTGNTVQLAKILGRLRREYGHDARLEIEVLAEWLKDASDILVRNVHVPLWKKYLKALQKHYRLSESVIMSTEKEEETKPGKTPIDGVERMPYLDSVSRFYKNRPVPSEQSKNDLADAVAQDEELVLAMMERVR